jgi:integrase/recombinase XerC
MSELEHHNDRGESVIKNFEEFLIGSGRTPSTVKQRMNQIRYVQKHIPSFPYCTETDLEHFMATQLRNAKPAYRKSMRSAIMCFFGFCTKRKLLDVDPAYQMVAVKVPRPLPRPVPEDALKIAYDLASEEVRCMILLGAMGGLRLSEITNLHMENREGNLLRVLGKGQKERIIPINASLAAALNQIEQENDWGFYFPNPDTHKARSISYVSIQLKKDLPPRYSAHSLRHRAASQAYGMTKDIRAVQELLGHASVATTQLYTAITSDDLRAVSDATDWVDNEKAPDPVEPVTPEETQGPDDSKDAA